MYRLFSKIPRGLEPVANIFKQVCDCFGSPLFELVLFPHLCVLMCDVLRPSMLLLKVAHWLNTLKMLQVTRRSVHFLRRLLVIIFDLMKLLTNKFASRDKKKF